MSSRVTRSSARQSADISPTSTTDPPTQTRPLSTTTTKSSSSRKRKAKSQESSPAQPDPAEGPSRSSRTKRRRAALGDNHEVDLVPAARPANRKRTHLDMSEPNSPPDPTETSASLASASKRKTGKSKKVVDDHDENTASVSGKRTRPSGSKKSTSSSKTSPTSTKEATTETPSKTMRDDEPMDEDEPIAGNDAAHNDDEGQEMEEDPFESSLFGRHHGGPGGLSNTLRALSGMMSGMTSRMRQLLDDLKQPDPSVQLIALQQLSEILLVSTEDNLAGHFSPDQFVKQLVKLMQPHPETGEENPEMMLLACRCIANMMEALPASTATVVYGGAVPVLISKLLEIQYMDLAEQALTTLEKISVDFPASIVRDGGLTACLTYLDFFPTSTQRTAVTTAANCCRNVPEDSLSVVKDVMPILLSVLNSSDQRVLEQGCICVSRIVESFKYQDEKLEELISKDLLQAILRLLLPGSTNLIGANIHTQFLRVLSIAARASPRLATELLKMDIVDTLYQILTGTSPPAGVENVAQNIDSVVIMQALIHRPREQVYETLNVVCELLPGLEKGGLTVMDDVFDHIGVPSDAALGRSKPAMLQKRVKAMEDCKAELKRFAVILMPTLTDAYSSTVNLNVRQKVLSAQLKMLSHLETSILEDALRPVPYASFLASILSQQDHTFLVAAALQAAELLLKRLSPIYSYQFHREGVVAEVRKLANRKLKYEEKTKSSKKIDPEAMNTLTSNPTAVASVKMTNEPGSNNDGAEEVDDEDPIAELDDDLHEEDSASSDESSPERPVSLPRGAVGIDDVITRSAKRFVDKYGVGEGDELDEKASKILEDLQNLVYEIADSYETGEVQNGAKLFARLAHYFEGDALESITSYELLTSRVVRTLLDIFQDANGQANEQARKAFVEAFMSSSSGVQVRTASAASPTTSFSVLVHKLQDLLSRSERFEVLTVHQNTFDSNRGSAASMLAKQIRIKLTADDESGIPQPYRNIMVSIHAIATFKALDDYLRPRISMSERPRPSRHRDHAAQLAAAYGFSPSQGNDSHSTPGSSALPNPSTSQSSSASARKSSRSKSKVGANTHGEGADSTETPTRRRSSRKSSSNDRKEIAETPPPPPPPPAGPHALATPSDPQSALECADETQLSDEDEDDDEEMGLAEALDSIVGELEEEVDDEEEKEDPSAVNMEIGTTGRVTARQEDGTRIATPTSGGAAAAPRASSSRATGLEGMPSTLLQRLANRAAMPSYAAMLQSTPTDWHLEFSINKNTIDNETTIYRAVHFNQPTPDDANTRNIWSGVHTITYKRVPGPPTPESNTLHSAADLTKAGDELSAALENNPIAAEILRLLKILHEMNASLDEFLGNPTLAKINKEPLSQFVNTKLTAKLNRQLEEPLIVASNCLPPWSEDLARLYPFLFPFETRHMFLQSTSFGYSRSMSRWQSNQTNTDSRSRRHRDERPFLGRLQRQKVRIQRAKIWESAMKVMELYGASPSVLEVEYFEEVGTGLGPTLEFYSSVSREFSKKKLQLWRDVESNVQDEFAFAKHGLFPRPMNEAQIKSENGQKVLGNFKNLGKFVARSMLDSRIIDVSFNPVFFRANRVGNLSTLPLGALKLVDEGLAKSMQTMKQFIEAKTRIEEQANLTATRKMAKLSKVMVQGASLEDYAVDFTLPGYPEIDLVPGGSNVELTIDNVALYIEKVIEFTVGHGVDQQIEAFRSGFSSVFPYSALRAFTPDELVMLFGRVTEDWSMQTLLDSIKADHGFNLDSKSVRNLLQAMSELDLQSRRDFLQFVTGSPKLPIGGFKSLTPMFTIVCKPSEPPLTSDDYLPSVMTCVNYLKLPDYSTFEVMKKRLGVAIKEGQGAFHLS